MSVPVLLSAHFYRLRSPCISSRFIFRTVLTLLQIHFNKAFITCFPFAYIVDAGIPSVFHPVNLRICTSTNVTPADFYTTKKHLCRLPDVLRCLLSLAVFFGKSYKETTAKLHRGQLLPLLFPSFCLSYFDAACCPPFCSMV